MLLAYEMRCEYVTSEDLLSSMSLFQGSRLVHMTMSMVLGLEGGVCLAPYEW